MLLTLEKLTARIPEIVAAAVRASRPLVDVQFCIAPGPVAASAMAPPPPPDATDWAPIRPGDLWGGPPGSTAATVLPDLGWGVPELGGGTYWLRARLAVPAEWQGRSVWLALEWTDRDQASLEAIVYLNGEALAGLDDFHRSILLPEAAHRGEHELLFRCFLPYHKPFGGLHLRLRDETIFQLGQTLRAVIEAVPTYRESDPAGHALLACLNEAYNTLDVREGWQSARFAESAQCALAALKAGTPRRPTGGDGAPTIIATGHAHLDVAWLWPLWRTRQKVAHTVANALHLMERYPEYHFSMSQPQVYAYLKEDAPALYARMKERIAEGRFEPVGMMWLEPDCNVTGGESLVRQLVQGARFFNAEFGEQEHVVWLPDVFGYSAALPQLMRGCGISCFMTTKISWNQFNRMPYDTFRWRGIDGSEVLTHFITASAQPVKHLSEAQFYTYVGNMSGAEAFGLWNHYRQKPINNELLYSYGWGDGGGGPTEEMLEAARVFADLPGFPEVKLGRVDGFFQRLYQRIWADPGLPTWVGELYLEYHRGTYTSQARTKQANRQVELRYREAEWLNVWAMHRGAPNRQAELDAGWRTILLNQFHDILPGSSVKQVYIDSDEQYAEALRVAGAVWDTSAAAVLGPIAPDAAQASVYAVVNSLPWERREPVRIPLGAAEAPDLAAVVTQLVEDEPGERALLAQVSAPAYGYTVLGATSGGAAPVAPFWGEYSAQHRLSPSSQTRIPAEEWSFGQRQDDESVAPPPSPSAEEERRREAGQSGVETRPGMLRAERNLLENDELRIVFDAHGEIASLIDKRAGREVVAPGRRANQLVLYEDRPLRWDAWDIDIFYEEKAYPVHDIIDWQVVESGPLRAALAITRRCGASTLRQRICLWRNSRRIDFVTTIDWQERQMLLRALFPLDLNAARATCEIQFGAVERPTHRNTSWDVARFEVCAQRWVDLSEGDYGVALLNDGKYGHSLRDNVLGLSLLKGAVFPDRGADLGLHRFTYSLLPHTGDWRTAGVVRRAYELNAPLIALPLAGQPSDDFNPQSFLSVSSDHVVVETIKAADDGDGLIVRLYEAHNQRGRVTLRFGRPVVSAAATDLLERPAGALPVAGATVEVTVRPFEVQTLRVRLG
jgi:alpha-mannosidase